MYNYYREAYAIAHPIYKPVLVFFPHGNKKLGLAQLKISADSSIFLAAESMTFLAGIYQDFEKDPAKAIMYSKKLKETFPRNHEYKIQYIRDLLVIKKFGEAESLLNGMPYESLNRFYQSQIDIFKGVIQEQKYKNPKSAEQLYWSGINKAETVWTDGCRVCFIRIFWFKPDQCRQPVIAKMPSNTAKRQRIYHPTIM